MELPNNYLEQLKQRKPESRARDYREEIAWRYLEKFKWTNERFEKDWRLFWITTRVYWKSHRPDQFESIMKWGSEKEVYPGAIIKVMNK